MNGAAAELRRNIRRRRAQLDATQINAASLAIARRAWRLPELQRARRIGVYLATGGEVDCDVFIERAWQRGRLTFAPILRGNSLMFAPLQPGCRLNKNAYGIFEPAYKRTQLLQCRQLDVALVPLVAADKHLNRLGMGGGYYDRAFAYRMHRSAWGKPSLVGLGYSFQRVARLTPDAWDVPLDRLLTETECLSAPRYHG